MRQDEKRTTNIVTQIKFSVLFKILAVASSFALIPVMLGALGEERYGVWVTMFGLISWIVFFDLGFGNGLRNKLVASLNEGDRVGAASYISSAYLALLALSLLIGVVFCFVSLLLDWQAIFNTELIENKELLQSILLISILFLINFVLSLVNQILHAFQKAALTVFHQFLSNGAALFFVSMLAVFDDRPTLLSISFFYGVSLLLASLCVSCVFFMKNTDLLPSLKNVRWSSLRLISGLGGKFFVIQLAVLVLFTTDKIIITQLLGPESVANYEVVFRLFSSVLVLNSLYLLPLWSAYTDAAHLWDIKWIRKELWKSHMVAVGFMVLALILFMFNELVLRLWVGEAFIASPGIALAMFIFVVLRVWCDIYSCFLNGLGKIDIQMWLAVLQALGNVPLSIYLGGLYGLPGVVYATVCTLALSAIGLPLHAYAILRKAA